MAKVLVQTRTTTQPRTIGTELTWIAAEQERIARERKISADLVQHIEDDLAYEQWKRENGIQPLDRVAYEMLYDPNGLYL